jgi:hypothetical protein
MVRARPETSHPTLSALMDTDRNLLFGVLALQSALR